jgi:hypothetical protein
MKCLFSSPDTFKGELHQAFQKVGWVQIIWLSLLVLVFIDSCKKDSSNVATTPPKITVAKVKPLTGRQGDTIIIIGTNFNQNPALDTVKFNGITAQVLKAEADTLYVIIPAGNCSGVVSVNGITAQGPVFTVTPPVLRLTSIKPTSGKQGDTIIITGANFNLTPELNAVKFNGILGQVIKANLDTLFVIVPKGNCTGVVTVNGISAPGFVFTLIQSSALSITTVTPFWGKQGDTILIIGSNFNLNPLKDTVTINGVIAQVQKASVDTLFVIVPLTSNGPIIVNGLPAPPPGFIYDPAVIVSTVAGTSSPSYNPGYVDGPGYLAQFDGPTGICFDRKGNLFVSEYYNSCIREISDGFVSTYAGKQTGASINGPQLIAPVFNLDGIAMDAQGSIYFVEGGFAGNLSQNFEYHSPVASNSIEKISNGIVSDYAGGYYNAGAMTFDSKGNLYVAQSGAISKITPAGQFSTFAGKPAYIGKYWVDSPYNYRNIWILNNGYKDGQDTAARFGDIEGLAVDAGNNIYAIDMGCACIRKVTPSGLVSYFALGTQNFIPPPMPFVVTPYTWPLGICINASGNLFVTEGNSILEITPAGVITTIAGSNTPGYLDGLPSMALFNYPNALALDAKGNLYISDAGNNRIRKITFVR